VDDIIFGGSSHSLVPSFQAMMENEFQMSMIGELTFFLKYPSQVNKGGHICTSNQVHEGLDQEVCHG
jgi:hypothetical protein